MNASRSNEIYHGNKAIFKASLVSLASFFYSYPLLAACNQLTWPNIYVEYIDVEMSFASNTFANV